MAMFARGKARLLGALVAVIVAVGASAAAPATAATGEADPIGQVLLTTAKASGVLEAIEGSLLYLGSKYGGSRREKAAAHSLAEGPGESPAAGRWKPGEPLPPASAGTNGTTIPPPPGSRGEPFVARIPTKPNSFGDPPANYVSGIALAPPGAPPRVAATINAANTIVGRPYVWGGGHGSWYARGYDCSGAVSFALAGGGFLSTPLTSGALESYGAPGPGRWITIYASGSHAYAVIAGLRWDTVGDARGSGPRWHVAGSPPAGFVARHPPGY
jgi:cell wall-associated NlpC family hydrolase